jgi:hypothetical protein
MFNSVEKFRSVGQAIGANKAQAFFMPNIYGYRHTHRTREYSLLFHGNNDNANASQCCVVSTLPDLLNMALIKYDGILGLRSKSRTCFVYEREIVGANSRHKTASSDIDKIYSPVCWLYFFSANNFIHLTQILIEYYRD